MTDERFPNGSLDRWLREHAENPAELPARDGWDQPSGRVWLGVRDGLARRKRRHRLIFWLCVLLVVAAGAGLLSRRWIASRPVAETGQIAPAVSWPAPQEAVAEKPVDTPGRSVAPGAGQVFSAKNQPDPTRKSLLVKQKKATHSVPPAPPQSLPQTVPGAVAKASAALVFSEQDLSPAPAFHHDTFSSLPFLAVRPAPPLQAMPPNPALPRVASKMPRGSGSLIFGAAGGYFFTTRTVRTGGNGRPNGTEHGAWTWQAGLTASRSLGRHWSVETGLQWTTLRLRAERQGAVRFRSNQERYDPTRDTYESSNRQQVQTSFGEVGLRVDLSRQAGQVIHDQEVIRLDIRTDERVHYLRLPLALHFTAAAGRWQWGAQAGLGFNFRTGYALDVTAVRADRQAIRAIRVRADRQVAGLNNFTGDLQAGLDLGYRFGPRCSVLLAPELRRGLGSMTRQTGYRTYAVSTGLWLALRWDLQ